MALDVVLEKSPHTAIFVIIVKRVVEPTLKKITNRFTSTPDREGLSQHDCDSRDHEKNGFRPPHANLLYQWRVGGNVGGD